MSAAAHAATPYADACWTYRRAGWRGVLPANGKTVMFAGWHGYRGEWPSGPDTQEWVDACPHANIALRLNPGVIGIDVDQYDGKRGGDHLHELEEAWGPLPPTWVSTSRDDGRSGIRFYRIPEGLAWPGEAAKGVEIIHYGERYTIVWPSIHPDTGRTYRWRRPDGTPAIDVPHPDELPELPPRWVAELTKHRPEGEHLSAGLGAEAVAAWLRGNLAPGTPCPYVATLALETTAALHTTGALHEAVRPVVMRLVRAGEQGHRGVAGVLAGFGEAFLATADGRHGRTRRVAEREWAAMLSGAVDKIVPTPTDTPTEDVGIDPCEIVRVPTVGELLQGRPATGERYTPPPERPPPEPISRETLERVAPDIVVPAEIDEAALAAWWEREQKIIARLDTLRINDEAKQRFDAETAARTFRPPPYLPSLVEEHALPDPPVEWAVEHLMPAGSNVLLISQYKSGKTTLVNNLAACLADGRRFLGRFPISAHYGRIALCNYEVGRDMFRRWTRDLGIENEAHVTSLNLRGFRMPITTPVGEDWMVRFLEENEITMWIMDPYARATVGSITSENDNQEAGAFLDALDVIKERSGVRDLILSAHTGRGEMEEGQERARGATRLDDWADVRWLLTKGTKDSPDDPTRFLKATGRDVDWTESALEFDEKTRRLTMIGGTRASLGNDRVREAILSIVGQRPGIGTNALRDATRERLSALSRDRFDKALKKAVDDKRIRKEKAPNPKDGHAHYIIVAGSEDTDDDD